MRENERMTLKPGMDAEYAAYVAKNQDEYGNCVIVATAIFAAALDRGATPAEANEALLQDDYYGGITGFMMGCAMQAIVHFHPRGKEVQLWWNAKYKIPPERAGAEGVANPAIFVMAD